MLLFKVYFILFSWALLFGLSKKWVLIDQHLQSQRKWSSSLNAQLKYYFRNADYTGLQRVYNSYASQMKEVGFVETRRVKLTASQLRRRVSLLNGLSEMEMRRYRQFMSDPKSNLRVNEPVDLARAFEILSRSANDMADPKIELIYIKRRF